MNISWEAAGATDVGRLRRGNEDTFHLDAERGVFIVADGMGGHAAGEVASDLATRAAAETLTRAVDEGLTGQAMGDALREAIELAQERIVNCCNGDHRTRGMGTTLTCCVLFPDGECHMAHIGDSRLSRMRDGRLEALTRDHTWVQQEVDAGRLQESQARKHRLSHILTRVLSEDTSATADLLGARVEPGDLLLICTDGLYNMVPDDRLTEILSAAESPAVAVRSLVDAANAAGGADNITALVVQVLDAAG